MIASLFVSTFDMPKHLALVFAGLERQSNTDFEILVCDDGSGEETRRLVETFARKSAVAVKHVWQEHQGFRKCRILNEAVRKSVGRIFIFLDGDCIPHRDFIRDHIEQQEKGRYLAGRRVELGPQLSAVLSPEKVRAGFFDRPSGAMIKSVLQKDSEHLQRTIRITWPWLRSLAGLDRIDDLKGCNYSIPREALEQINGFDEEYEGYGREDTDVELRLQHLGLKIKSLKGLALQFHVWHPRRAFTPSNDTRLEELKKSGRVKCRLGLTNP